MVGQGRMQQSRVSPPGFNFSAKFRRNFGFFSVSASYRDPKFRYFSIYFVSKFKIQQISSEIHRNSPKFRNGIPFPPISGISPENEMVNPGQNHLLIKFSVSVISFMHIFSLARNPHSCHCSSTAASSTRFFLKRFFD